MKKKTIIFLAMLLILTTIFSSCQKEPENEYSKYDQSIFDTFDTIINVIGYTKTEEEFDSYVEMIQKRYESLHKLYDIYNDYEGINNIKTINDNAGIKPVKVDKEIIDLILFAKDWYERTGGQTNIAMGPVLRIWHDYREEAEYDPENAKIPPMEELKEAAKHTEIDKVIVDAENSTVYLVEKEMRLDVGAIAKGFATEIVTKEVIAQGFSSGIISAGGNIRVIGKPLDNARERWGIGIHNPDKLAVSDEENLLDTVFVKDASVVSSGDYQRYYIVDGKVIHHLIDPKTLMPGDYYRAVTVVAEDSGVADFMSTTVFLLPFEESLALVESTDGVEAVWVFEDGRVEASEGMKKIMLSHGASGSKAE